MSRKRGRAWLAVPVVGAALVALAARAQPAPVAVDAEALVEASAETDADEGVEEEETEERSQPSGPLPVPRPVSVGLYIVQIPELALAENSSIVDFYLWFRWQGDDIDPSSTYEFMNLVAGWDLSSATVYTDDDGNPLPEDLGDGWRYQLFHVQARFGHPFDTRAYPFDSQDVVIILEDTDAVVSDMVYVADDSTHVVHPTLEIPGWELGAVSAEVLESHYPTNFGDTRRAIGEDVYSRFRYEVRIHRPVIGYSATTLLPIAIVMLITMVMFLIESKYFEGRLGLGITSLISAVALQLTASSDLPSTGYLVLLDHVYNLSYAVIFLGLLESVVSVRLYDKGEIERARRIDIVTMIAMALLFFGGVGLLVAFR
jgi:hypothetical protein